MLAENTLQYQLLENALSQLKVPDNVQISTGDFGDSLLGTNRNGILSEYIERETPCILDKMECEDARLIIPLCSRGHWGFVVVFHNGPEHQYGTVYFGDSLGWALFL